MHCLPSFSPPVVSQHLFPSRGTDRLIPLPQQRPKTTMSHPNPFLFTPIILLALALLLMGAHAWPSAATNHADQGIRVELPAGEKHDAGCGKGLFACDDFFGPCLLLEHVCDGKPDCVNGKDEVSGGEQRLQ